MKILISLSKKNKSKNPRSAFLSALMTRLSDHGMVVDSFAASDKEAFTKHWSELGKSLLDKMPKG
jgi:hypothetical protein